MIDTIVQQSSLGVTQSILVSIIGGLAVVFVPFVARYFQKNFRLIRETAERVDRHHEQNKKIQRKLDKGQKEIIRIITEKEPSKKGE